LPKFCIIPVAYPAVIALGPVLSNLFAFANIVHPGLYAGAIEEGETGFRLNVHVASTKGIKYRESFEC
jgi:hypothetical protein